MKWLTVIIQKRNYVLSGMLIGLFLYFTIGLDGLAVVALASLVIARCWESIERTAKRIRRTLRRQMRPTPRRRVTRKASA